MNYCFVPSLQNMAATKIVTLVWNRASVVSLIAKYDCGKYGDQNYESRIWSWRRIEEIVNHFVSLLPPLPASLREQISSIVVPIGNQIYRWKMTHAREFRSRNVPQEFCWTSRGTLDKKKTAEVFVRDLTLPEKERYFMACFYCLEVPWDFPVPFLGTNCPEYQVYWAYNTKGDATILDRTMLRDASKTPYQCAFQFAVQCSNEVAAEYYFRKLTPLEREASLSNIELPYSLKGFDTYRFLLQHMNDRQRSKLLEAHAEHVLEYLLTWPWQQFFMDMARRVRDTLKRNQYFRLLETIVTRKRRYKDFGYRKLFGEFWMQIPLDYRKDIVQDCRLFWKLSQVMGKENVSMMLRDVSPEEKEHIILSRDGVLTCASFADNGDWDGLRFLIVEYLTTRHKMIHFKEHCQIRRCIYANRPFFRFLDELIERCSENSGKEEADCPVPNILCSSSHVSTDQVE